MTPPRHKTSSTHRPENGVLTGLLRELRLAAGMTQAQAGLAIGLTQKGISDFETGDRGLELLTVRDLVHAYGGDWAQFIAELDRRLEKGHRPAATLIRRVPHKSGQ
ncbi:helix-turn-helix transcriptional regulator [Luteibacter sp. SG786]|uniref:helix-turn-helix domain-containing protein n=1 Tax=Luteibacter sp. SG786 TaxID=2587130 RepID=UPI0014235331|nr:helix-turn-helix transcriptional regulator [Luteibacter sp. SG786]NII56106.1 transcriptional regulator with XRE-family HTH domain [Luteibacter sp. SG786]